MAPRFTEQMARFKRTRRASRSLKSTGRSWQLTVRRTASAASRSPNCRRVLLGSRDPMPCWCSHGLTGLSLHQFLESRQGSWLASTASGLAPYQLAQDSVLTEGSRLVLAYSDRTGSSAVSCSKDAASFFEHWPSWRYIPSTPLQTRQAQSGPGKHVPRTGSAPVSTRYSVVCPQLVSSEASGSMSVVPKSCGSPDQRTLVHQGLCNPRISSPHVSAFVCHGGTSIPEQRKLP